MNTSNAIVNRPGRIFAVTGSFALACTLSRGVAAAEVGGDPPAEAVKLEEVLVTAKARTQDLQEVPLSITVIRQDDLQESGIRDPRSMSDYTPNFFFFSHTGRQDASALVVRGLNPNTTDERYQGVSFFLDGIPLSGTMASLSTLNIERVEIIKGPQSATFGRATYSAAIDYITTSPKVDEFSGSANVRFQQPAGDADPGYQFATNLNFPLVLERLWLELGGIAYRVGALSRDEATRAEIGREETRGGHVGLYWEPADGWTARFRLAYDQDQDSQGLLIPQHPRIWAQAGSLITLPNGMPWTSSIPDPDVRELGCNALNVGNPRECGVDRDRTMGSLIATRSLSSGYEITYRGAWFRQRLDFVLDANFYTTRDPYFADLPAPVPNRSNYLVTQEEFLNTSHQLSLISPSDSRVRWRAGIGLFDEVNENWQTFGFGSSVTPANPDGRLKGDLTYRSAAVFGAAEFAITPALNLALEGRVEREEVGYEACAVCATPNLTALEESTTNFLPRVTLSHSSESGGLLYALYSYGTRPGRFNDTNPPDFAFAEKEKLDNFEVGSKNTLLDGRLVLNFAAFYQKLRDQQIRIAEPGSLRQLIQNIGSSRIFGFEIESNAALTEQLGLQIGLGYSNHEYTAQLDLNRSPATTTNLFPAGQAFLKGLTSINTPPWNGFIATEYRIPLTDSGRDLALRADVTYRSSSYVDVANIAETPAATRLNLRATFATEAYDLAFFVRNATDNRASQGGSFGNMRTCLYDAPEFPGREPCGDAVIARPREVGVEITMRF